MDVDLLEKWNSLADGASKTLKHEIKKPRRSTSLCYDGSYGCFVDISYISSLIHPVTSSLINTITGNGVRKAGKGEEGGFFLLLTLLLKSFGKSSHDSRKRK